MPPVSVTRTPLFLQAVPRATATLPTACVRDATLRRSRSPQHHMSLPETVHQSVSVTGSTYPAHSGGIERHIAGTRGHAWSVNPGTKTECALRSCTADSERRIGAGRELVAARVQGLAWMGGRYPTSSSPYPPSCTSCHSPGSGHLPGIGVGGNAKRFPQHSTHIHSAHPVLTEKQRKDVGGRASAVPPISTCVGTAHTLGDPELNDGL